MNYEMAPSHLIYVIDDHRDTCILILYFVLFMQLQIRFRDSHSIISKVDHILLYVCEVYPTSNNNL